MKQFVVSLSDEDIELLNEEFENLNARGIVFESLEECLVHAAMTHCRTMHMASSLLGQLDEDVEDIFDEEMPMRVGVLNMPVHLNENVDREEFSEYITDVLNQAIDDFNNNNNGPVN